MVTTKLNLSMTEPSARQIYAKQGDTGRVLDITLDQTPEDGTLRILRPDGVEVTSDAVTGAVTELTVGIEPVQDLNGYDKPWVGGAGKNLVDNSALVKGYYYETGEFVPSETGEFYTTPLIPVQSGATYASSFYDSSGSRIARLVTTQWDADGNMVGQSTYTSVTMESNTTHVRLRNFVAQGSVMQSEGTSARWQLELGSTATSYEPYSNICPITGHDEVRVFFGAEQGTADETYTTSLGQTVYGGTLDMVSGVLTVDRAMASLSGSDLGIGSSTTKELNMWRLPLNNPYGTLASSYPSGISNKYVLRNSYHGVNNNNGSLGLNQVNGSQVLIRDDSLTTAQEVIDAFNSTPLTFVYPLAEPQTYQLTPQQIKTLVGTNNVWASSGDIVSIKFTYGGLLSELPSDATSIVGKCYCDIEQNGVSSMPFTLNVKKNERAT